MLQLAPQADRQRMNALNEIKDAAGEWHDWLELETIAKGILNPKADSEVLTNLKALTREQLHAALAAANRLRKMGIDELAAA